VRRAPAKPAPDQLEERRYRYCTTTLAIFNQQAFVSPETFMKILTRAAGALALALTCATPACAGCSLTKVSEMAMTELGHHYAVMAKINDVVRPMIVDTGAEATMLTASFAEEIKLAPDNALPDLRPVLGIGQIEWHLNVIPSVLGFGDLIYRDRSTVVAAIDEGQLPERESVGLLGADILSQFDAEFDFPANKLTLYRTPDCFSAFAPWTGSYSAIPFEHRRGTVVINVFFDEEQTRAMVDTGNDLSYISRNAAVLAGVPDAAFTDPVGTSRSPLNGGTSSSVRMFAFNQMRIGDETFSRRLYYVDDVDFLDGSANLGMDYWRTRKIWISYPNNWLFVSNKPASNQLAYPIKEAQPSQVSETPDSGAAKDRERFSAR
jgi:hypothetical protein